MLKFSIVMDHVAYSLNEVLDLFLHTFIFTFLATYVIGGLYDFGYAFFFVVPGFILCSPLLKNIHKRHLVEWVIKVPVYLFIGLLAYLLCYGIMATNIDGSGRTATWNTFFIIFLILEILWVYKTLQRLSKPPLPLEQRRQRSRKRMLISGVFSVVFAVMSVSSFMFAVNLDTAGQWSIFGDVLGAFLGILFGVVFLAGSLMMIVYFFASLLDRT